MPAALCLSFCSFPQQSGKFEGEVSDRQGEREIACEIEKEIVRKSQKRYRNIELVGRGRKGDRCMDKQIDIRID